MFATSPRSFQDMSLATGTRLGPYEVTSRIGAGAMGEVYREPSWKNCSPNTHQPD